MSCSIRPSRNRSRRSCSADFGVVRDHDDGLPLFFDQASQESHNPFAERRY